MTDSDCGGLGIGLNLAQFQAVSEDWWKITWKIYAQNVW